MSVIIRLQNLPWSANALDIRQLFKGLAIPEGGVHIVGGEQGDAFIAFSTDEDARQAMMHDRECIKEVQVRLLLSSRAEMQKVIETARLNSISIFQQLTARSSSSSLPQSNLSKIGIPTPLNVQSPLKNLAKPQGVTSSFLAYQQQAGITVAGSPIRSDFDSKNSSRNEDLNVSDERSRERDRRRSPSWDREIHQNRSRSRSHSREKHYDQDRENDRWSDRDRLKDRDSNERNYDRTRRSRSRDRSLNCNNFGFQNKDRDLSNRSNQSSNTTSWLNASSTDNDKNKKSNWGGLPSNSYQSNNYQANSYSSVAYQEGNASVSSVASNLNSPNTINPNTPEAIIPAFQSYSSTVTNNYSINMFGGASSNSNSSDTVKPVVLKNPYTTAHQSANASAESQLNTNSALIASKLSPTAATTSMGSSSKINYGQSNSDNTFQTIEQEPIAFAKTNPYEQMYPSLFAQAAAQQMPRSNATAAQRTNSPSYKNNDTNNIVESSTIKVSNMCTNTNYSDLRKFFSGLFIPHNGIKMVNDKHGLRTGVAYIQFSRSTSVPKAMTRNNTTLKLKTIKIETVSDEEFAQAEDSYRPPGRFDRGPYNESDSDRRFDGSNQGGNDSRQQYKRHYEEPSGPFSVVYLEELPPLTTEQDLMKMFSSYTLYDIFMLPSAENRREFVAYVKFSLAEDAKAALEDKSKHMIGYRKVRVYAGKEEDMEKAKEKLRLANEQLLKEEEEEMNRVAEAEKAAEMERNMEMNDAINKQDEQDDSMSSNLSGARISMRDPRLIPSLLEVTAKPPSEDDEKDSDRAIPSDPRLRTRSRPSRFDNDTKNSMSSVISSGLNNNLKAAIQMQRSPFSPFVHNMSNNDNNISNNNNNNNNHNNGNGNNNNKNFNDMSTKTQMPYAMEQNFLLLYNCPYSSRPNDIGKLFHSANFMVKHVEMLNNDRGMPSGEFIVEVINAREAENAFKEFHNYQFHGRNLRVRRISPQEIADRLRKPFFNYIPGGGNFGNSNSGMMNMRGNNYNDGSHFNGNSNNGNGKNGNHLNDMRGGGSPIRRRRALQRGGFGRGSQNNYNDNDNSDDDNYFDNEISDQNSDRITNNCGSDNGNNSSEGGGGSGGGGMPEKFTCPNCVVVMENVPYKADLDDILRFFSNFNLRPDDIIRRFNDDGTPTGDARVAFLTTKDARDAYEKHNRKQIFNRTIYLSIL